MSFRRRLEICVPGRSLAPGAGADRHRDPRAGHRRQRGDVQRRPRRVLRPLVNRDESRLIYIRQSAPGIAVENMTFSVPDLMDLRSRLKTVTELGDFSTISFTIVGLGVPGSWRSGVVGGSFFNVMGLRRLRGRLIDATDDGPMPRPSRC